jgi:hypothetical protein
MIYNKVSPYNVGGALSYVNPLSHDRDNIKQNVLVYPALATTLTDIAIKSTADPITWIRWKCLRGSMDADLTQYGATAQLSSPNLTTLATVDGTWPASDTGDYYDDGRCALFQFGSALDDEYAGASFHYFVPVNPDVEWHIAGDRDGWGANPLATSNRYLGFGKEDIVSTLSIAYTLWPVAGTFKFLTFEFVNYASSLPHNVLYGLLIDGAESNFAYTHASIGTTARHWLRDTTTAQPISAGSKVCFYARRSHATGTCTFGGILTMGFIPD